MRRQRLSDQAERYVLSPVARGESEGPVQADWHAGVEWRVEWRVEDGSWGDGGAVTEHAFRWVEQPASCRRGILSRCAFQCALSRPGSNVVSVFMVSPQKCDVLRMSLNLMLQTVWPAWSHGSRVHGWCALLESISCHHRDVGDGRLDVGGAVVRNGPDVMVPWRCGGWVVGWWRGGDESRIGYHGSLHLRGVARGVIEGR